MDPEALLEGLDDAQRAAVTSTAMPLVVLAPAGSGKTRVLTRRIAYRVATGSADPRHVLALTFTRKAAGELDERLAPARAAGRRHHRHLPRRRLGAPSAPGGPTSGAAPLALLDRKGRLLHGAGAVGARQGQAHRRPASWPPRSSGPRPGWSRPTTTWTRSPAPDASPASGPSVVAEVYAAYEHRKRRGGLVDFDDLLALVARALEEDEAFAAAQRWRFRHLFVDELQDVNPLQFRLLQAWRGDRYDVTAVGDPQQAIYGWNGADAGFLLDIHRWWPPAEVIELTRSYRSTPEILDGAAAVLRAGRQPAREVHARPGRRRAAARRGPPRRPSRGHRHRPRHPAGASRRGGRGRSRRCSCAPTPRPTSSPRRSARVRHPAPGAGRGRVPRPSRDPAGAPRPARRHRAPGHRAADLEEQVEALAGRGARSTSATTRTPAPPCSTARPTSRRRSPPSSAWATTTCGSTPTAEPTAWRRG